MKNFLYKLFILFFISLPTYADNANELLIDGFSVGESLLSFMSIQEIKKAEENSTYYKDKKFIVIFANKFVDQYEEIEITYIPTDKNYIIQSITGKVSYSNDFKGCQKQKKIIRSELKAMFKSAELIDDISPHGYDETKESIADTSDFFLDTGYARVSCTDWAQYLTDKNGWEDTLKVSTGSEKFMKFISGEPY